MPPRSAIVAFSAEQVYAIAEMLRRFRGGAAVVMGALSPQTRNAQVALYQSGEVDYLVATDAIGMGLNLDIGHVAFAGLSSSTAVRQRRLTTAKWRRSPGAPGRHQRDGTFGTLAGTGGHDRRVHRRGSLRDRGAPLPAADQAVLARGRAALRQPLATLIADLERPPRPSWPCARSHRPAVLKRAGRGPEWQARARGAHGAPLLGSLPLPDFRQHGAETHARFVARLWQDLRHGYLGSDYVAQGDCRARQSVRRYRHAAGPHRRDPVMGLYRPAARLGAGARGDGGPRPAVEARLSDALHARLTERFVNRRTSVLMKNWGRTPACCR
jgi:ATP-dependent RNA helicase SUPV3L1/SUV3